MITTNDKERDASSLSIVDRDFSHYGRMCRMRMNLCANQEKRTNTSRNLSVPFEEPCHYLWKKLLLCLNSVNSFDFVFGTGTEVVRGDPAKKTCRRKSPSNFPKFFVSLEIR